VAIPDAHRGGRCKDRAMVTTNQANPPVHARRWSVRRTALAAPLTLAVALLLASAVHASASAATSPSAASIVLKSSDFPVSAWRDLGALRDDKPTRYQRQIAACMGAPDPAQGSDYALSHGFGSRRPSGELLKSDVYSIVQVAPSPAAAAEVLQALQASNARACLRLFTRMLNRNLARVARLGVPQVNIETRGWGSNALRARIAAPLKMRLQPLKRTQTVAPGAAAKALPDDQAAQAVDTAVVRGDSTLHLDQVYAVRGSVVMAAHFVGIGAAVPLAVQRVAIAKMLKRAKPVPEAAPPPGAIVIPPPVVTPIEPLKITVSDLLTPPGSSPGPVAFPPPPSGNEGPKVTLETCAAHVEGLGLAIGDNAIPNTNLNVHVSDTCLPTVQILVAPVTSKKCKPKWYQYVDLEAVWLCGGPSSSLLLGPAATGIGKTPFIMAFPHISAF
jgi:hypothetical protein